MGKTTKAVTHKALKSGLTACGRDVGDVKKSNSTYRGVTCVRCLRARNTVVAGSKEAKSNE